MSSGANYSGPVVDPKQHFQITMGQKMLAACSGSLLTSVVVNPFDVVRVRLQQQSAFPLAAAATAFASKVHPVASIPADLGVRTCCKDVFWYPSTIDYCVASELECCAVDEAKQRRFTGTFEGIKKISQFEGATTLWRGLSLTLLMSIPSNVVYFTGYEFLRDNSPIDSELLNPLLCGSVARTLAATVVSPIELAKTRLQSASSTRIASVASTGLTKRRGKATSLGAAESPFRSVMRGIQEMVAQKGITSLWKGLVLTLWRDVPFSGIYWACVEFVRRELNKTEVFHHTNNTFGQSFIAGSIGGSIAAIVTTPFDVGKTRQQVGHHASASSSLGMMPLMMKILREEGISALYVGAVPRILKVAPACAIMISSYEVGKKVFKEYNSQSQRLMT
ncbi:mitochondrial carrier protein Mtm1p [Trichomonascus vanleenenianus]|uniref:Mtm1p n=1 Tax=Trichomonascus vanleenenianus TaxID=2268995 RepID=UPI003EC9675C